MQTHITLTDKKGRVLAEESRPDGWYEWVQGLGWRTGEAIKTQFFQEPAWYCITSMERTFYLDDTGEHGEILLTEPTIQ